MSARAWFIATICLLLGAMAAALVWRNAGTAPSSPSDRDRHESNSAGAAADGETTRRFLTIEARAKELDATLWKPELEAQEHERVFVRLWDQLRTRSDSWAVLKEFPFDEIDLGIALDSDALAHGIRRTRYGEPRQTLNRADAHRLFDQLKQDGYRLVDSEWRQSRFETAATGSPRSIVEMKLHWIRPESRERHIVRAKLHVHWRARAEGQNEQSAPTPERIRVEALECLAREGEAPFETVLAKQIQPEHNPIFIDPLIVYDLNGDGLVELILACRNFIYWNLGNGRFQAARLCRNLHQPVNAAIVADFDGDALADLLCADQSGVSLYAGDAAGRFERAPQRSEFTRDPLLNPFVLTAGDIDADGDLDVWLAQYKLPYIAGQMPTPYFDANDGFPSYLLINDGRGVFRDGTAGSGLEAKRFRRTYSSSLIDLDGDRDLDLVVVSDFAGVDLFHNDGRGRFDDVTTRALDENRAFGMAHTFGDYDLDGRLDLFVIGMNSHVGERLEALGLGWPDRAAWQEMRPKMACGNRLYFQRDGLFLQLPASDRVARSGWSWGVTTADFDNDGDGDLYVANGHKSKASVEDYENQFWRHDIYLASSKHDPALDLYFQSVATRLYGAGYSYGGYYKNCFFLNEAGASFSEIGHLMGVALEADSRNVASADLDNDGRLDLLVTTFEEWPVQRQVLHVFRNRLEPAGNWIGFHLRDGGRGYSPVGAKVLIETRRGRQIRALVTGDSYRSQHPATAHFGLGGEREVLSAEILWPNGRTQRLSHPPVNQYHRVAPGSSD